MQMKKYLFPTLREATEAMKEELGEDAIVMSTRVIEDPVRGRMFELIAAIDKPLKQTPKPESTAKKEAPVKALPPAKKQGTTKAHGEDDVQAQLELLRKKIISARGKDPAPAAPVSTTQKITVKNPASALAADDRGKSLLLETFREKLLDREIAPGIVKTLIAELKKNLVFMKPGDIELQGRAALASLIPCAPFEIKKQKGIPATVALVGPTGVGKTTCIAKLAVISKLIHKLDVGLISLDTYRLGALDQMRIFSEISNIDFLAADEPGKLPKLLNEFKKKQLVFIDTAGRSQNNKKQLLEMKQYLDAIPLQQVFLTLSASTGSATLIDATEKFSLFNYSAVIFTKTDEAAALGGIVNVLHKIKKPAIYLTNGQVIPDDIVAADPEAIAAMVLGNESSVT